MKKKIQFILIYIFQIIPIISVAQTTMPRQLASLPEIIEGKAVAGKITSETLAAYKGTAVHHSIYLPRDYHISGSSFPIIVELTGNKWAPCGSTGKVENAHLGYSLTLGLGAVVVSVPYVAPNGKENELKWWGDIEKTVSYIEDLIPYLSKNYNVDTSRVLLCGFSRGSIGVSYVGLHDKKIATLWSAFFTHDHFDGQKEWRGTSWAPTLANYRAQAKVRLERADGRPWYVSFKGKKEDYILPLKAMGVDHAASYVFVPIPMNERFPEIPNKVFMHEHNDCWPLFDIPEADKARKWVKNVLEM